MNQPYPIGTEIKFSPVDLSILNAEAEADIGKQGKVIGYINGNRLVQITLQDSEMMKYRGGKLCVTVDVANVQPLTGQLLFGFMY